MAEQTETTYAYYPVFRRSRSLQEQAGADMADAAQEFEVTCKEFDGRVTLRGSYSSAGFRPDADLLMWWLAPSPEDHQDLLVALRRTALGRSLELTHAFMGVHRQAEFNPAQSNREFSILLSDFTMQVLMPHVLRLAYAASPSIRFRLLPQQTFPYLEIDRGEADLLIAPKVFSSPDHPSLPLFEDDYCCVVWKEGRFGGKTLTEKDFAEAGHVRMVPSTGAISFEDQFLERRGIARRIEATSYSFTSLPYLVVGTDRIATVHGLIARQAVRHLPVESYPLPFPWTRLDEVLQWHGHRSRDPGLVWLRGIFEEAAAMMMSEMH
jgi:DNA-binding transcriptional LysR family regulator